MYQVLTRVSFSLAAGLGVCTCGSPAMAQDAAILDRVFVSGAIAVNETELETGEEYLDSAGKSGIDDSIWKVGATLGGSHRFQASHGKVGNVYRGTTTQPVTMIGGVGYLSGAEFSSALDVEIQTLSYTWFFSKDAERAFGIGVGASRIRIDNDATVIVAGFPGDFEIDSSARERVTLPQVRAEYARLVGAWRIGAEASVGRKSGDELRARSIEAAVSLEYLPAPVMAVGVRYAIHRTHLEPGNQTWLGAEAGGDFRVRSKTPQLYITLRY